MQQTLLQQGRSKKSFNSVLFILFSRITSHIISQRFVYVNVSQFPRFLWTSLHLEILCSSGHGKVYAGEKGRQYVDVTRYEYNGGSS